MATLTKEEIEQKTELLKEILEQMHTIHLELIEAGAYPLDDDELDGVAGGVRPSGRKDRLSLTSDLSSLLVTYTDWIFT